MEDHLNPLNNIIVLAVTQQFEPCIKVDSDIVFYGHHILLQIFGMQGYL